MISKGTLIKVVVAVAIIIFIIIAVINLPSSTNLEEKRLFPQIIGDMILKDNETGIYSIRNITSYDNFRGNIIQGYKATYSGSNGTMIIFIAQMPDNDSAIVSIKDMAIRAGYNESAVQDENTTTMKVPYVEKLYVKNPEVFVIQKSENVTWHYTFAKSDKVYWIAFNKPDAEYQLDMLREVYVNVDK